MSTTHIQTYVHTYTHEHKLHCTTGSAAFLNLILPHAQSAPEFMYMHIFIVCEVNKADLNKNMWSLWRFILVDSNINITMDHKKSTSNVGEAETLLQSRTGIML